MGAIRPGFNKYQSGGLQHLLASQIREEVGAATFNNYFKFSFVRNPWDKVVSQFHYIKTRPMLLEYMGLNRWTSFRRYVETICGKHQLHVQSYEQWRFVYDTSAESLVDFIGRFETLERDFQKVAERIGLACTRLPHKMKTKKRKTYHRYYDKKSMQLVADTYARDIQLFGYDFG